MPHRLQKRCRAILVLNCPGDRGAGARLWRASSMSGLQGIMYDFGSLLQGQA